MTLEIGTRLGHYRIVALLGRGGMSDVYRAEDEHLGREVALKAVPPEFARYPERVKRFEREVRAAAGLTHANIVTVHEFGQHEGQLFYTMALMTGGDLKARIREHPEGMPLAEARAVAATMARALDYAHQRGFVHRDVKPENILFGEDGAPRLTDFGIARVMEEETRMTETGRGIGSPRYMSPEQARGQAVDGRSDIYSLGVVFYEMLTGQVPFDAVDTFAVGLRHINDPIPRLPEKLAAWQPVLDRVLAKVPEGRYASAGELAQVLASDSPPRAPGSETVSAQPEATGTTPAQSEPTGKKPVQPISTGEIPAQTEVAGTTPAQPETTGEMPAQPEAAGTTPAQPETTGEMPAQPEAKGTTPAQPEATGARPAQPEATGETLAQPDAAPTTEPGISPPPASAEVKARRSPLVAVAGGVLVLALAGIGYFALQDGNGPEPGPPEGAEEVQAEGEAANAAGTSESGTDSGGGEPESAEEAAKPEPDAAQAVAEQAAPKPKPTIRKASARAPQPAPKPSSRDPKTVLGGGALLVVETTPPGTEVLVDGRPVGKTPLERSDIRAGVWEVTLQHPHYEPLRISGRKFEDGVVTRLERALKRGVGRLTVTATPRRAWVEVEGKRLAERTPVTLNDLPAGEVKVKLGAPEHRPLSVEVVIPKDGLARLQRRLEKIVYGSLTLDLEPSDATVTLPDLGLRYRPGVRLPQGAHRVLVRKKGYREASQTVQVSGAKRLRIALEKVPEKAPQKPAQRIRVGGRVQSANLIRRVRPDYPPLARQSRIQGTVVLEAIISKQGYVDNLRVIRGHPMLTEAAMNAVKQWYYKPTVLNGAPVEVITRVTVNFSLTK